MNSQPHALFSSTNKSRVFPHNTAKSLQRGSLQTCAASFRKNSDLLSILGRQASKETLPWLQDLAFPVIGITDDVDTLPATSEPALDPTQLADPDSNFITLPNTDGLRLHYKERSATTSNTPTILLLHGFNGSTFSWRANMDALAEATGCRVLAFDRPPFGLSSRPLSWGGPNNALSYNPYELQGSIKLTEAFLDAMRVTGPVIAVGHSAGGMVALELAKQRPWQIKALGLVAPAVPTTSENSLLRRATFGSQLRFLAIRAILQNDSIGLRYVRRQLLKQKDKLVNDRDLGFTPHPATASSVSSLASASYTSIDLSSEDRLNFLEEPRFDLAPDAWEEAAEEAMQEAIEGYIKPLKAQNAFQAALLNLRAFMLPPVYDYSTLDEVPVLVVQGNDDGALTQNAKALAEILEERRKQLSVRSGRAVQAAVVFEEFECKHAPMEELPAQFNGSLIRFVQQHGIQ